MQPLDKHGYVLVIDDIKINGKPISGTNIRDSLSNAKYTTDQKKKFFQWAFGFFDPSLYTLLTDRFSEAVKSALPVEKMPSMKSMVQKPQPVPQQPARTISKETFQQVVAEMLGELSTPQGGSSMAMDTTTDTTAGTQPTTIDLNQQKRDAEAKAKQNKQQRDSYDTTVKNYDRIQKKTDRDQIDAINKQISQPSKPSAPTI
jgi:hypothetical protein